LGGLSNENSFSLAPLRQPVPEETECCARVGLKAEDLAAHKAKEAEITRVLAKVSTEDMVVLRCLVGEDRAAQASRYIALKGLR